MSNDMNVDNGVNGKDDDEEENAHFQRIRNAFKLYRSHAKKRLAHSITCFKQLPQHHRDKLPHFPEKLTRIRECIEQNAYVVQLIIDNICHLFENKEHINIEESAVLPATELDLDKVKSTLKQFVRDWSVDGEEERATTYRPVIDEILRRLPANDSGERSHISVLVPGAGLGRLAFEIARLGYCCQGNEFSLFMLFASNFVLNKCTQVDSYTLYPWVHQYCNNWKSADQLRPITFPDINPSALPPDSYFSMVAGDFLEVYTEPDKWDCVATVFFIDTAHNIMAYIETIANILKPGGYWINLGPLLYHYADIDGAKSLELSYEDLVDVIEKFNFRIVEENTDVHTGYIQNRRSMLTHEYHCVFFVAQKTDNVS